MDCSGDVDLVKVPLDEVNFGAWRYKTTGEEGIALFHREGSSNLYVRTHTNGTNNAPPATFTLRDITGMDLALVSSVPGALESMVVRCTLETESDVVYESHTAEKSTAELTCHLVTMKASVHKAGELRDMLLQLKTGRQDPTNDDLTEDDLLLQKAEAEPRVTPLDALPAWIFYIPTWLYTRKVRITLEKLILVYTVFSVFWASWQLYRHVHIIQVTFQPFIDLLKKHLASVMETFDMALIVFTEWWAHWFSPLSIFLSTVLAPVLMSLKASLVPLQALCTLLITNLSQLLASSSFVLTIKGILQSIVFMAGTQAWRFVTVLVWPARQLCMYIVSFPLAVASLDASRVRFSWVLGMVTSSFKAIGNGTVKLFNYLMRQKQRKAHRLHKSPTRLQMDTPRKTLIHIQSSEHDKCKS